MHMLGKIITTKILEDGVSLNFCSAQLMFINSYRKASQIQWNFCKSQYSKLGT